MQQSHLFFIAIHSTCFGRPLHLSSGVHLNCSYSHRYISSVCVVWLKSVESCPRSGFYCTMSWLMGNNFYTVRFFRRCTENFKLHGLSLRMTGFYATSGTRRIWYSMGPYLLHFPTVRSICRFPVASLRR
jgi:hypothetical protein